LSGDGRWAGLAGISPASVVVHGGRPPAVPGGAVSPAVWPTSTYRQGGELTYGRDGNRTWEAFEEVLGALEGGACLLFASGMAAIAGVLECLPVPGRVVVAGDAYSGTRRFLSDVAGRGRLRFRTVDIADADAVLETCVAVASAPGETAGFGGRGLLWVESPSNPLLAVADLEALCAGAHEAGMDVAVDNTFATPLLQRPLDLGADVVVHSATKMLSGHSDVILGATVSRREDVLSSLATRRSLHGAIAGPWEAWLGLRGMRTLAVRLERAQSNAAVLAERLSRHPSVTRVRYPGLAGHPGHDLAARQMSGFGNMIAFEVAFEGDDSAAAATAEGVVAALRMLTPGTSLGGVETLIERRARWEAERHLPPALIRMSVGIEDVDDIWADLDQALSPVLSGPAGG
jgi:cystathionine gamma-synthase